MSQPPPQHYRPLHDPEQARSPYRQSQYTSTQQYQQPPFQPYSQKQSFPQDNSAPEIYSQVKFGLRIASGLFCIALIISCIPPLTVSAGRSGWQFAYYGPPAFIALAWDIFDVISTRRRQGISPIHAYIHIIIELALWVTFLAVAIVRGSDGDGNTWWSGGSSLSSSARAALAFAILLLLVHLTFFGLDCYDLYQRNRDPQPNTTKTPTGLGIQNPAAPVVNPGPPELETSQSRYGELDAPSRSSAPTGSSPRTELDSTNSQRTQYAQLDSQSRPAELPVGPVEMPADNYAADKEAGVNQEERRR